MKPGLPWEKETNIFPSLHTVQLEILILLLHTDAQIQSKLWKHMLRVSSNHPAFVQACPQGPAYKHQVTALALFVLECQDSCLLLELCKNFKLCVLIGISYLFCAFTN